MDICITSSDLRQRLDRGAPAQQPLIVDVRRAPAFSAAEDYIAGALRRDPQRVEEWMAELPRAASIVVYCVHGHEVSQTVAKSLRDRGLDAAYLDHGLEGWRQAGAALTIKPIGPTAWVTRERPKIDRIACPWLVRRFIDRDARFLYVPASEVRAVATAERAQPYDIPEVELGHVAEACSFDAFIARFRLGADVALARLATIVRGADTGRLELAPQAAGLLAISLGLSRLYHDDLEMLAHGLLVYDALYRWCQEGEADARSWNMAARA
jgi:rhodanese-related sulfurtransferase